MVNENVSLVISRQILSEFTNKLSSLPDDVAKEVCHYTLEKIQPRVISFEEQVFFCTQNVWINFLFVRLSYGRYSNWYV